MTDQNIKLDSEKISMTELVSGEDFPAVQPHAIAASEAKKTAEKQAEVIAQASQGPKKRGRKSNAERAAMGLPPSAPKQNLKLPNQQQNVPPAGTVQVDSTSAAVTVSGILEKLQVTLISDDFIYSEIERAQNITAWKNTLDYYGGVSLSPPAALALDHASIILTRAHKEKTQSKIAQLKTAIAAKYFAWKNRKMKKEEQENALSDSGQDTKRENNLREEKSAGTKKAK